jgi:hypothetical protein
MGCWLTDQLIAVSPTTNSNAVEQLARNAVSRLVVS